MKLKSEKKEFDSVGGEAKQFSVDTEDTMIIRLLRDKMYKNKIGAVCREVSSNSRDANREAGRKDTPIMIEISSGSGDILSDDETYITFKDNGIGISPDRMERIFLKYGGSTKRDSDAYTGGFGIGAKTPFAYTDNFFITTVAEVDGKRMKYSYQAAITSDGKREISQMINLGEEETNEQTGTTISVPINSNDSGAFMKEIIFATSFWNVKPILKGFNKEFKIETIHNGKANFKIVKDENKLYGDSTYFIALIDEIPYILDLNQLKNADGLFANNNQRFGYSNAVGFITVFEFKTGEITVSGSREDVEYVSDNVKMFSQANKQMKDEVRGLIEKYLKESTSYYDRCVRANKIKNGSNHYSNEAGYISFLGKLASSVGIENSVIYGDYEGEKVVDKHDFRMHDMDIFTKVQSGNMKIGSSLNYLSYGDERFDLPIYYLDLAKSEPSRNAMLKSMHSEKGYILIKERKIEDGLGSRTVQQEDRVKEEKRFLNLIGLDKKWTLYSEVEKLKKEKDSTRNVTDLVGVSLRYLRNSENWDKEWTAIVPQYDKKACEFVNLLATCQQVWQQTTDVAYFEVESLTELNGTGYSCPTGMDKNQQIIHSLLKLNGILTLAVSKSKVQYFEKAKIKSMKDTFIDLMKKKKEDDILIKTIDFAYASSNKANQLYFELDFKKEINNKLKPLKELLQYAKENNTQMDRFLKVVVGLGKDFTDEYEVGVSKSITDAVATLKDLQEKNPLIAFVVEAKSISQFSNKIGAIEKQLKELFNSQKE